MNFLAHIYLSFDDPQLTLGNFMADSIRGREFGHLPETIQQGIVLHRSIDTYTDTHPIPRQSSRRLHSRYSHYSRVIVDIYYDHFLARHWEKYHPEPLHDFVERFYLLLRENRQFLPGAVQRLMPHMIRENWLANYANLNGISRVLEGMNRRTGYKSGMHLAVEDLTAHYESFGAEFESFFEELIIFSRQKIESF